MKRMIGSRLFLLLSLLSIQVLSAQPQMSVPERLWKTARYGFFWFAESLSITRGLWGVFALAPCRVTFLGSSRVPQTDPYAIKAHELAQSCARNNIAVITGGGSGVMEAAARGVHSVGNPVGKNLGVNIGNLEKSYDKQPTIFVENFEIRQWVLFNFSSAVIFFPGGLGTLYELMQVLNLLQVRHMKKIPVILFGSAYWQQIIDLLNRLVELKLMDESTLAFMRVVDSVDEAAAIIRHACQQRSQEFNVIDY